MAEKTLNIEQGKIYWVDAEPHAGHEEGGHSPQTGNHRRPVLVISNDRYNRSGMALVFPITSSRRRSRYLLPIQLKKPSQVILTQILGYDMIARQATPTTFNVIGEQLDYLKQIVVHMV